jgi:hypothetical protein
MMGLCQLTTVVQPESPDQRLNEQLTRFHTFSKFCMGIENAPRAAHTGTKTNVRLAVAAYAPV